MSEQTVWREGNRVRATDGMGYADLVSDDQLRTYAADKDSSEFDRAFAAAVLAIRAFERCDDRARVSRLTWYVFRESECTVMIRLHILEGLVFGTANLAVQMRRNHDEP